MFAEQAYLFRHALLRDAAYELHLPGERARLHSFVVEAMEALFDEDAINQFAEELAAHCRQADSPDIAGKELDYTRTAIDAAERTFRNSDAIRLLGRLLALADESERAPINLRASALLIRAGDPDTAQARAVAAVEAAGSGKDDAMLAEAEAALAVILARRGKLEEADAHADLAREAASGIHDPRVRIAVENVYGEVMIRRGRPEEARASYSAMLKAARACGDERAAARAVGNLAVVDSQTGRAQESIAGLRKAIDLATRANDTALRTAITGTLAVMLLRAGKVDEAVGLNAQALLGARQVGDLNEQALRTFALGEIHRLRGEQDDARKLVSDAQRLFEEIGDPRHNAMMLGTLATIELSAGNTDGAIALGRRAITEAVQAASENTVCILQLNLAAGLIQAGELEEAQDLAAGIRSRAANLGDPTILAAVYAVVAQLRRAQGDKLGAVEESARAVELQSSSTNVQQVADILCRHAGHLVEIGELEQARQAWAQGVAAHQRTGFPQQLKNAHAELSALCKAARVKPFELPPAEPRA